MCKDAKLDKLGCSDTGSGAPPPPRDECCAARSDRLGPPEEGWDDLDCDLDCSALDAVCLLARSDKLNPLDTDALRNAFSCDSDACTSEDESYLAKCGQTPGSRPEEGREERKVWGGKGRRGRGQQQKQANTLYMYMYMLNKYYSLYGYTCNYTHAYMYMYEAG